MPPKLLPAATLAAMFTMYEEGFDPETWAKKMDVAIAIGTKALLLTIDAADYLGGEDPERAVRRLLRRYRLNAVPLPDQRCWCNLAPGERARIEAEAFELCTKAISAASAGNLATAKARRHLAAAGAIYRRLEALDHYEARAETMLLHLHTARDELEPYAVGADIVEMIVLAEAVIKDMEPRIAAGRATREALLAERGHIILPAGDEE